MQPETDAVEAPAALAEAEGAHMPPHINLVDEVAADGGEHTPAPLTLSPIREVPMPVELPRYPAPMVQTQRFDTDYNESMWELVENGRVIARQIKDNGDVNIGKISLAQLIPVGAAEGTCTQYLPFVTLFCLYGVAESTWFKSCVIGMIRPLRSTEAAAQLYCFGLFCYELIYS